MRDIKFRIYDKELKESHIEELQDVCEDDYWYDGETDVWSALYDSTHEQERFIALQFTGLKDKNEKEIYEGDIVKFRFKKDRPECPDLIGFIEYQEQYCSFKIVSSPENGAFRIDYETIIEVIGNIYDNPDLIKG